MFHNPLDSFHNTVAIAKAEREQLDRLLTVSPPRELLLLSLVLFLFVLLSVWTMYGSFERKIATTGTVIEPFSTQDEAQRLLTIDLVLGHETWSRIEDGMMVTIQSQSDRASLQPVQGEIQSKGTSKLLLNQSVDDDSTLNAYQLQVSVAPDTEVVPFVGHECLVFIKIGRQTPLTLISETLF